MDRKRIEVKVQVKHLTRCIDIKVVHSRVEPDRVYNRFLPFESILPSHEIQSSFKDDYHENICANNISNLVGSSILLDRTKSPFCSRNEPLQLNESLPQHKSANSSLYETDKSNLNHQAKTGQDDPYSHVEFKKITFNKKVLEQNDPEQSIHSIKTISNSEIEQADSLSHLVEANKTSDNTEFQPSLHSEQKEEKNEVESISSARVPSKLVDQEIQTDDYLDQISDLNQDVLNDSLEFDQETINKEKDSENLDSETNQTIESEFESLEIKNREEPAKILSKPSEAEKKSILPKQKALELRSSLITKQRKSTDEEIKPQVRALKSLSTPKRLSTTTQESISKIPTAKTASSQPIDKSKPLQFKCGKFDPKAMSKFEMSFQQKFKKST